MSTIVYDKQHVTEAVNLLTGMFKDKANIVGFLQSFVASVQDAEDALNGYIIGIQLLNATGATLDLYGKVVDEPRYGRSDNLYRQAIIIRIAVNDSQGKVEDILNIAALAFGDGAFTYNDSTFTAAWELTVLNTDAFPSYLRDFHDAKASGTRGVIITSNWPPSEDFVYDSVYGGVSNSKGYTSIYGAPAVSGKYVTAMEV